MTGAVQHRDGQRAYPVRRLAVVERVGVVPYASQLGFQGGTFDDRAVDEGGQRRERGRAALTRPPPQASSTLPSAVECSGRRSPTSGVTEPLATIRTSSLR
jgi:hypothetical protein